MHNTCYSSTLSLRCKGSPSFSYDGYSNFLNDGIGTRNPIHPPTSSCCSCCTNSIYRAAPLNPSILYGLRQSTLIQWSTCKRLILGVGDRYYYRFPVYDVDRSCDYGNSYSFKERSVSSRRGKWRKGKFGCMVSEDMDNVEVMLSLLTEVSEECLGVRERKGSSYRKVQIEKKENSGKKKNVGSGLLESNSRCEFESVKIQPKGENYRRKEDRERKEKEILSRGENRRVRKEGSSCSSYYSVSSSGDVESDNEVRVKNEEGFVGESWSRYNGDLRKSEEIVEGGHERENSAVGSYKLSSGLEYDWRKKSEKKLNEISTEQSESSKNLSQNNSRLVEVHESDYVKTSASHKQSDKREERSNFSVNIDEGKRKQFKSTSQQVSGESESRMKYKRFGDREENLGAAVSLVEKRENEHHKTDARITKQDESRWKSQQLDETSEIQEIGFKGTSISQGTKDQHYQESLPVTGKMDSRRKSELLTETSHTHDADIVNTSTSKRKSDTRMKKQEARSDIVLSSSSEERDQRSQTGHKETRLMESSRKSQDFTNTQRASENRKSSQEIHSTVEEIRKIRTLTDERVLEIGSGKEGRMLTKASSFSGGFSKEASSSSLSSSHLKPHARVQEINVDEEDNRNLQTMVIAPSSQLVERGPYILSPARSQAESQPWQSEIHGGARRDEAYGITSHKDALVSADRMQKSSDQFIGEFAEKVKHEFSTSETQIGMKSSETTLVSLGQKSQHGSGDSESKKHESRGSSRSSGTKGPSDEIWDVTDPSIVGPPKTEVLSGTTATTTTTTTTSESAVSKRTGRSLWNIIGDIIRLRWTPRSDSHNSAAKSGGKSSPNQSVSSETWFSGHEQEENNDDNGKEQTNDPVEAESFGQQKVGKVTAKSPEGSSSRSSKDKIRHVGVDKLSSSSILESGSASKSISSASGDENIGSKEDRKNFLSSTSGTAVLESSVLLPGGPTKSPVVEEISEAGQTEEISGTGAEEGELKRRKFQRANQVMKDRFDDWEEAYILESEQRKIDEMFMREALLEAKKAADVWEVPVGAVLVQHGKIIARGYNLVEELRDSTAHAEMICIREASNVLRTWRLSETTLYVTLEPCPMCAGAILQARVDTVVWGAPNKLLGADGSWIRLFPNGSGGGNDLELRDKPAAPVHPFHPKITIRRGVLASECSDEMQQFFQLRRRKKDKKEDTSPSSPQPSCLPVSHHPSKLLTKMHDAFHLMFCL